MQNGWLGKDGLGMEGNGIPASSIDEFTEKILQKGLLPRLQNIKCDGNKPESAKDKFKEACKARTIKENL